MKERYELDFSKLSDEELIKSLRSSGSLVEEVLARVLELKIGLFCGTRNLCELDDLES